MMLPLQLMLCLTVWMLHTSAQTWKMWYFPSAVERACVCSIIRSKALSCLFSLNRITNRGLSINLASYCVMCPAVAFLSKASLTLVNGLIAPYLCLHRRSSDFPAGCCFIWMASTDVWPVRPESDPLTACILNLELNIDYILMAWHRFILDVYGVGFILLMWKVHLN